VGNRTIEGSCSLDVAAKLACSPVTPVHSVVSSRSYTFPRCFSSCVDQLSLGPGE
jgi:hypothetical protein